MFNERFEIKVFVFGGLHELHYCDRETTMQEIVNGFQRQGFQVEVVEHSDPKIVEAAKMLEKNQAKYLLELESKELDHLTGSFEGKPDLSSSYKEELTKSLQKKHKVKFVYR